MEIDIVEVGLLKTNCYILKKHTCIVIDPGDNINKILNVIGNRKVSAILLTHSHFDHIGCVQMLLDKYNCRLLKKSCIEEKTYKIDSFIFDVIFTPGHSSDSVSYYFKDDGVMFVGDFIFRNSIGRTDLETGSIIEMKNSLNKIKKYSNITLYPGHGEITTIDYEKENNLYLGGEI